MGILWSSRYDPDREIGDQTGRVFLITGANSGLGYETTRRLAAHGATIYLACRSRQRAENAIAQIESELPQIAGARRLRFLQVDLSNLRSVISAADEFMQREAHLHVLIHNAARMPSPYELSPDGVEMHIAVNYLAAAVLTDALSPVLEATARIPNADVRILALSSGMYSWIPAAAKFDTVEDWNMYGGSIGDDLFSGYERYGTSKTMCILWASHLQRAFDRERLPITAVSLHPGFSRTESALDQAPRWFRPLFFLVTLSVEQGAHTTLFAATSQELWRRRDHFKGKYLEPFGKITRPSVECARDRGRAQILWDATKRISASILST